MNKLCTLANSIVWETLVGSQTPQEFVENGGVPSEYVNEINANLELGYSAEECVILADKLADYIADAEYASQTKGA